MKVDEGNEVVGTTGLAVLWGQHSDSGTHPLRAAGSYPGLNS